MECKCSCPVCKDVLSVAFFIDLSKEMLKKCYWHGVGSILCEREESKEHFLKFIKQFCARSGERHTQSNAFYYV